MVVWIESAMEGGGDDQSLLSFLMECAPLMATYAQAQQTIATRHHTPHPSANEVCPLDVQHALRACHNVHLEFLQKFVVGHPKTPHSIVSSSSSQPPAPGSCSECQTLSSIVEVEDDATWVCTTCGAVQSYGSFARNGGFGIDESNRRQRGSSKPYRYDPNAYFRRSLNEVQGIHTCVLPAALLAKCRADIRKRYIDVSHVGPNTTRAILKRVKESRYYRCRWALAKKLNPTYEPIRLSSSTMDRMMALFRGMTIRFPHLIKKLNLNRKILPNYPTFTRRALLFLGFPKEAAIFKPLKSHKRKRLQFMLLDLIFMDLVKSTSVRRPPILLQTKQTTHSMGKPRASLQQRKRKRSQLLDQQRCGISSQKPVSYKFSKREKRVLSALRRKNLN